MTTTHAAAARIVADPDAIRAKRYELGLSGRQLAVKAGLSQTYMSRIETGDAGGSPRVLRLLADALGSTVAAITKRKTDTA